MTWQSSVWSSRMLRLAILYIAFVFCLINLIKGRECKNHRYRTKNTKLCLNWTTLQHYKCTKYFNYTYNTFFFSFSEKNLEKFKLQLNSIRLLGRRILFTFWFFWQFKVLFFVFSWMVANYWYCRLWLLDLYQLSR